MKVNIVAVGKIKEKYFTDAINEYAKRLSRFTEFSVVEVGEYKNQKTSEEEIQITKKIEGERLLKKAKGVIIAMDRQGKMLSSEELACKIKEIFTYNASEISFLIGGSNGLSQEVINKADYLVSFGKITYPHQLMRVILSEQIYRAFTINNSLPYHK